MKTLIQIVLVALTVGGLSAGGSYYWRQQLAKSVESAVDAKVKELERAWDGEVASNTPDADEHLTDEDSEDRASADQPAATAAATSQPQNFGPAAAVRPPFDEFGDEAGNLINIVRRKAASASHREKQVVEREEAMNLILNDLRFEQTHALKLKRTLLAASKRAYKVAEQVSRNAGAERSGDANPQNAEGLASTNEAGEIKKVGDPKVDGLLRDKEEALRGADQANTMIRNELDELRQQIEELRKPRESSDRSGSPEETGNIKKTAERLDSMPPEQTAKILKEMALKKKVAGVIAILNTMDSRQSAKVLSVISTESPELAAELVERLKTLKAK